MAISRKTYVNEIPTALTGLGMTEICGSNAEASLNGVEDLVSLGAVGSDHAQSLGVHLLSNLAVLQRLGVDEDVQRSSLQSSLADDGAAAGVGNSQAGALLSEDSDEFFNRFFAET